MFKLVTGSPGDGKTSNELWDFLNAPQYKNRPKFCTPINGFNAADHGVTEIAHIKDWQELPEGAAVFCDEVQDYCGTDLGKEPPEWVKQLARHRHHGYDFICTTQSPMFLHPFARKLVKPHVHYIRPWNMKGARYTWDTVQNDPTTRTAKNLGQRVMVTPNPKVFTLYESTVLDTHKAKPPYKLFATLAVAAVLMIALGWFVFGKIRHYSDATPEVAVVLQEKAVMKASAEPTPDEGPSLSVGEQTKPIWTEKTMKPRIAGNLYTAPVYDSLTAPTDFPRVAACMSSESRGSCNCYTQQGTPIDVPKSACLVFVSRGAFDPWFTSRNQRTEGQQSDLGQPTSQPVARAEKSNLGAAFTVVADNSHSERKTGITK
jgi:zona occludens toxin